MYLQDSDEDVRERVKPILALAKRLEERISGDDVIGVGKDERLVGG